MPKHTNAKRLMKKLSSKEAKDVYRQLFEEVSKIGQAAMDEFRAVLNAELGVETTGDDCSELYICRILKVPGKNTKTDYDKVRFFFYLLRCAISNLHGYVSHHSDRRIYFIDQALKRKSETLEKLYHIATKYYTNVFELIINACESYHSASEEVTTQKERQWRSHDPSTLVQTTKYNRIRNREYSYYDKF